MSVETLQQTAGSATCLDWDLANEYPDSSLPGEGDAEFSRRVGQLTGGRVRIRPQCDVRPGLGSRRLFDAVSAGRLVLADSFAGALGDVHPLFQLSSLPFMTAGGADARRLFELARPHYDTLLHDLGQKLLYASPWPPTGLWTKAAIGRVQGLQGLRVRTYDATSAQVFIRLGADARAMAFTDSLPLLASGGLDAVLSSGDGGAGAKLWQHLPYFTPIDYAAPLSLVTINLAAWNALDAPMRLAMEDAAAQTMQSQWRRMQTRVEENTLRLRDAGATIVQPGAELRAAFAAAAATAIADWTGRAGSAGHAILAQYRRQP
ncbi:MAG: TRAP transporter substrate-binding protein [Betaproteobacteria bacterium]